MSDDTVPAQLEEIRKRLDRGANRMTDIENGLRANTKAMQQLRANTDDLVAFFGAMQGAFKVLSWIGKAARPIGWIATAAAAVVGLIALLKGGGK